MYKNIVNFHLSWLEINRIPEAMVLPKQAYHISLISVKNVTLILHISLHINISDYRYIEIYNQNVKFTPPTM